jgi:hypothetical protein
MLVEIVARAGIDIKQYRVLPDSARLGDSTVHGARIIIVFTSEADAIREMRLASLLAASDAQIWFAVRHCTLATYGSSCRASDKTMNPV